MRSMAINASSTVMPLIFGAAGTALGAAALFWLMGGAVGARQSWVARRPAGGAPASLRSGCLPAPAAAGAAGGGLRGAPARRRRLPAPARAGAALDQRGRRRAPASRAAARLARVAGGVQVGSPVVSATGRAAACAPMVSDGTVRPPTARSRAAASSSLTTSFSAKGTPRCSSSCAAAVAGRAVGGGVQRDRVARRRLAQLERQTASCAAGAAADAERGDRGHARTASAGRPVGVGDAAVGADHLVQRAPPAAPGRASTAAARRAGARRDVRGIGSGVSSAASGVGAQAACWRTRAHVDSGHALVPQQGVDARLAAAEGLEALHRRAAAADFEDRLGGSGGRSSGSKHAGFPRTRSRHRPTAPRPTCSCSSRPRSRRRRCARSCAGSG